MKQLSLHFHYCFKLAPSVLYHFKKKMIQSSTSTTFLQMRLLAFFVILLAATAADDEYKNDSATPSFLRRELQTTKQCNRRVCPGETPTPGGLCCYSGSDVCKYRYTYLWDYDCQGISCTPVVECQCIRNSINRNKRTWQCLSLSAFMCLVTDTTPIEIDLLIPLVGTPCTP